jgi:uncharacterized protein
VCGKGCAAAGKMPLAAIIRQSRRLSSHSLAFLLLKSYFNENSLKVRDMLRKLRVENFFSIGPMVELDLSVAKNAPRDDRYATPDPSKDERFAKVAVLYGPNASGKTNVLRAAAFLLEFIHGSFHWKSNQRLQFLPCLTAGSDPTAPSLISIEFDTLDFETNKRKIYSYTIKFNRDCVLLEELKTHKQRWTRAFYRENSSIKWGDFKISSTLKRDLRLPPYASVLSTLTQYQNPQAMSLVKVAKSCFANVNLAGKYKIHHEETCRMIQKDAEMKNNVILNLGKFDINIKDIKIKNEEYGIDAIFEHNHIPTGISRIFESQGTVNLFTIIPYISSILDFGTVAFIDELDGDLHPSVVAEIVRRFTSSENKNNAQLVMTCHNPALLRHLSKDEVHIVEKSADHFTQITALKDMAGVRRDANLEAQYLGGAFGGLPLLA